jgi:hypothetical protein
MKVRSGTGTYHEHLGIILLQYWPDVHVLFNVLSICYVCFYADVAFVDTLLSISAHGA